ncbi:MAG TPA: PP2C family protein-serine/threonine phosphatase [Chthoniobacterales bacterium]
MQLDTTLRHATEALASTAGSPTGKWAEANPPGQALEEVSRIRTGDEIEALAGDFTIMAGQLIRHQENLKEQIAAKTAEIQSDLDMARELQQAFLPREYPQVPSRGEADPLTLHFHHLYQAAMSVSGDFCDVIKLDDHRAGVFIADVMGHGTRSALVTAILRTLLHNLAQEVNDPAWFLSQLNRHFHETMKQTDQLIFVTACYVVIDTQKKTVRCASAGHPSPLCCNRLSGTTDLFFDSLKNNPAIGLLPHASYTSFTRRLHKGDIFLLFTDGVIEAMNEQDEEFGQTRLLHCVENPQAHSLSVLTHGIVSAVKEFTGQSQLMDDLCLVAVEAAANPVHAPSPEAAEPAVSQSAAG